MENYKEQEEDPPRSHVSSILDENSFNEEDFIDDSDMSKELDIIPMKKVRNVDFKQENLSKRIPDLTMLCLIAHAYPDLVTETNEITIDALIEILREGADANCLECLSDDIIIDLAIALDLPVVSSSVTRNVKQIQEKDRYTTTPNSNNLTDLDQDEINTSRNKIFEEKQAPAYASPMNDTNIPVKKRSSVIPTKYRRLGTILKDFEDDEEDLIELKTKSSQCPTLIDPRLRYCTIMLIITLISVLGFILFATIAYFNPMFDAFGPGILFSRGAALSILLLTMFAMFLVTYELTTWCRGKLKRRCNTLFDFQILFHRFSGFLICFYSYVHTIGHLTGSVRALDQEKDMSEVNDVLTHKTMSKHKNYLEICFTTIPGVTGILLLVIITLMTATSIEYIRRRAFQLFATVHVFCFPLFIILIIVHGSDTWLNYGFPLGSITVGISLLIYLFYWLRKLLLQCRGKFEVGQVETTENGSFVYLNLKKPDYFKPKEGQYVFINCPKVSYWEWHPFSICSSELSPYVSFLIKNSGDWTNKLIEQFSKQTSVINTTELNLKEMKESIPSDRKHQQSEVRERNGEDQIKDEYPEFYLSPPISSPAVLSKMRKNVVYIGTGAGNATFLCFADRAYIECKENLKSQKVDSDRQLSENEKADMVFISRELEHMRWIGKYIEGVLTMPEMTKKLRFHIYITIKDKANSLASFLFWRALTLYNKQKEDNDGEPKGLFINLGRPNFNKLIGDVCVKNDVKRHFVYACGPDAMIDRLQKICCDKSNLKDKEIIFNFEIF